MGRAAEDLGLVINVHSGGASKDILPGPGHGADLRHRGVVVGGPARCGCCCGAGVFDRHPTLRFAVTEDGAWWLPDIVERMDEKWVGGHNTRKFGSLFRDAIERKPSEYLGTNVFLGASTPTRHEIGTRDRVGVRTLLWGNDFPHPEGTWPHTRQSIHDVFHDVPDRRDRADARPHRGRGLPLRPREAGRHRRAHRADPRGGAR